MTVKEFASIVIIVAAIIILVAYKINDLLDLLISSQNELVNSKNNEEEIKKQLYMSQIRCEMEHLEREYQSKEIHQMQELLKKVTI